MTTSVRPVNRSSRYQRLLADLQDGQKTVLLDGPISTELDSRGVTMASGKERRVAKDDPESLVQVHVDYINAGARIITTNTFGRTRQVLGNDFEELTRAAVDCAFEARRRTGTEDSVVVAGSLAYHTAKGPGKYDPEQDPESWEDDLGDLVEELDEIEEEAKKEPTSIKFGVNDGATMDVKVTTKGDQATISHLSFDEAHPPGIDDIKQVLEWNFGVVLGESIGIARIRCGSISHPLPETHPSR